MYWSLGTVRKALSLLTFTSNGGINEGQFVWSFQIIPPLLNSLDNRLMHYSLIFFCESKWWWWWGANVCVAPTCINWGYFGKSRNDICHWSVPDNAPMWPRVHPPRLQRKHTTLWNIKQATWYSSRCCSNQVFVNQIEELTRRIIYFRLCLSVEVWDLLIRGLRKQLEDLARKRGGYGQFYARQTDRH